MCAILCPTAAWNNTYTLILIDRVELSPWSALCIAVVYMWEEAIESVRTLPPFTPPIQSSRWDAFYFLWMCESAYTAPFTNVHPSVCFFQHLLPSSPAFFRLTFDPVVKRVLEGHVSAGEHSGSIGDRSLSVKQLIQTFELSQTSITYTPPEDCATRLSLDPWILGRMHPCASWLTRCVLIWLSVEKNRGGKHMEVCKHSLGDQAVTMPSHEPEFFVPS